MSRIAPFSLRLSDDERKKLESQAGAMPLSSYIKSVVLADDAPKYRKQRKPPVAEQQLLAEILARLGQTRQANNLNQIAKHLNQGTLVIDDELHADLLMNSFVGWNAAVIVSFVGFFFGIFYWLSGLTSRIFETPTTFGSSRWASDEDIAA